MAIGFKSPAQMVTYLNIQCDICANKGPACSSSTGTKNIRWLGDEALRRYLKLKPPSFVPNRQEVVHDIRRTVGGAICDPQDMIRDVLDDNDFVSIGNIFPVKFSNNNKKLRAPRAPS